MIPLFAQHEQTPLLATLSSYRCVVSDGSSRQLLVVNRFTPQKLQQNQQLQYGLWMGENGVQR
jgi:hypothetical protein